MEDKQKVRDRILYLLKRHGAQTATALAAELQVSPMAIRQHLQNLKGEQWVSYAEERRPLGRPVKLWQLTPHARARFPDSHADLMLDLLKSIETVFGSEGLERLVTDRSQRQMQTYREKLSDLVPDHDWRQRVETIAALRTQEGYMAEVIEQDDALLLVENHCPIHAAAQSCSSLCRAELEVFRTVLGTAVTVERVEHILQGDRRCAYRVSAGAIAASDKG